VSTPSAVEMFSLIREVVVLCWDAPATSDRSAHKIAAFLGSEATFVALTPAALGDDASIRRLVPRCKCLIVNAETLVQAADAMPTGISGLPRLTSDAAEFVFIYGFQPTERHGAILRALSSGGLVGIEELPAANAKFQVAEHCREWSGQFSGLSFGAVDPRIENAFLEGHGEHRQDTIVRAGDRPFFVSTEHDGSRIFFLACRELADLDEKVRRQAPPLSWFSRLVPLMMFLRGALGSRVWHNDNPRACFIIDDPLLKSHYGFLEYERLAESIHKQRFSACVAFIPWNYRRSSDDVIALFSANHGALYLCIHGCDHTRAEFATTDAESLRGKAQLALERMRAHRRLSGISFDDVMVFPQGLFSAEAIAALKASGYLAAINSDVCPSTQPESLALRDLLEVAVTSFAEFPLFGRRYPRDLAEFAFDLFMGKPALAVEHHGYFRDGYQGLESFVAGLNSLDERLEWTNPGTICSRACLTRTAEDGDIHVRFYTSRFQLTNTGPHTQRYLLLPRRTPGGPLPSVTIDGRESDCELEQRQLKIRLSLEAGQTADIRVLSPETDSAGPPWKGTKIHNAKVWIRRVLCEFRDNHVETNRVLNAMVSTVRNSRRDGNLQAASL
jgi:hypothetical protein